MLWDCICLTVCLSQVGVLLKRYIQDHINSATQQPRDSSSLMPKILAKFDRGQPIWGPNAGGWVKIGDFRQITGYISKTVLDKCAVSIKVEYGKSYMQSIEW